MQRRPVSSSNLRSVGYDDASSVLEIEFKDGSLYQYSGVPASVYRALMSASSHGVYFHANIRDRYPTRRIA